MLGFDLVDQLALWLYCAFDDGLDPLLVIGISEIIFECLQTIGRSCFPSQAIIQRR